jgi:DNA-binding transcriptional ArsR family regulator
MDFLLKLFKGLANKKRIKIIEVLITHKKLTLEDIVNQVNLPYKTVARNLKILEKTGLVTSNIWRGFAYYSLNDTPDLTYNRNLINLIKFRLKEKKNSKK